MFEDEKARALESKGLYRRAAGRWLEVLMSGALSASAQQDVLHHRKRCLARVRRAQGSKVTNFSDVSRAAKATQAKMGLSQPGGSAFRQYKKQP